MPPCDLNPVYVVAILFVVDSAVNLYYNLALTALSFECLNLINQ